MIERFEQAAVAPRAEPPKHRRSRRQIVGKEPPSDPASQHIEDGVQDLAQGPLARPPSDAWLWHVRLDPSPFGIGQISFVTQPFAAMLPPSGRGPHRASSKASTTHRNHGPLSHSTDFRDGHLARALFSQKPVSSIQRRPLMPKSTSWRHVLPIHPAANLFPLMGSGEMSELTRDIKQKGGILSPVTLWLESGKAPQLLDGRNRLDAMEAAGLTVVDKSGELVLGTDCEVLNPSDGVEPFAFVLSANLHRRHLTPEQKRGVVAGVLKARPGQSNRRIARAAKVDHKTVGAVGTKLEATGEIPQLKETVGADGKKRAVMAAADRAEERAVKQQAKAERRASREADLARKITALPSKRYGLLFADPPWRFEPWSRETGMDRAADNHYPTMTADEIRALDVASIAAPDSVLWLWATAPMLPDALA